MSRLDELIAELCPDGVEYKEIQELFYLKNGYTPSKSNPSNYKNGTIPWFRMEDIRENGGILSDAMQKISQSAVKGSLFPANSIIVATSATIGVHALVTVDFLCNQRFTCLYLKDVYNEKIYPKFIYYICFKLDRWCLNNSNFSSFASVDMSKFRRYKIPVPPLPVQEEIVRILDTFSELTAELIAELSKRKQQYQYYMDMLLTFDGIRATSQTERQTAINSIAWRQIIDICEISRGKVISKDYIRYNIGNYPVYSSQTENNGELGRISTYIHDGEYITWTTDGANAGSVFYRFGKFSITNVCGLLKIRDNNILTKYVYYSLGRVAKEHVNSGMGNPKLMSNMIAKIKIPVPPLEEQKRIVAILDRFDALCNDLTSGLPAEIEARKKQYEYYRDKLLTFKEAI